MVIAPSLTGRTGAEYVCSIGFFDGVHCGHQCLIRQVQDEALRRGARSLLITFDRHPRSVFAPDSAPALLTTAEEKMALLEATGVDEIYILPFDREMAALSAKEFMQQVLKEKLNVGVLVIGYDHHFGRPRQGSPEGFEDYQSYGREVGIEVVQARELEGEHVSSSAIRRALEAGDIKLANQLLGHPYTWTGRVVHGHEVGRQLGFPTANLEALEPSKILPKNGAYAVAVKTEKGEAKGMLNIGTRPTIDNGSDVSVEVHLFDVHEDLYDQTLTLSFITRLREERRFSSEAELTQQLQCDQKAALKALTPKRRHWWGYILLFFVSQLSAICLSYAMQALGETTFSTRDILVGTLLTANLLGILFFFLYRPPHITWVSTLAGVSGKNRKRSGLVFLLAIPLIFLVNLLQEILVPDMPDWVDGDSMNDLMFHPLGLLTITLFGPLSEELLFRGGVQTNLEVLKKGNARIPILISALVFSIIHLNPAQMPVAFLLGLVLGFAYWWTDSLIAPFCIHVFNNSMACVLYFLSPDDDSFMHLLGGLQVAGIISLVCLFFLYFTFRAMQKEGFKRP